ncbi:hypothetical protein C0J52_00245 [Blattella germanica]|nr:hypothetical protein C0J52_00245 [Blattella germanica]
MLLQHFMVCCILLYGLDYTLGGVIPNYNLTVNIRRNETGHLYSDVHFNHDSQDEWRVYVNNTPGQSRWIQTIVIYPKELEGIVAPTKRNTSIGYEKIPDFGYYKLHYDEKTWQEATNICKDEEANIFMPNTDPEAHRLGTFMENNNIKGQSLWAGFHDQFTEGSYVTVFNQTLEIAGFSKWRGSEPGTGDCGVFYYDSESDYGLAVNECTETHTFICEKRSL